MRQLITMILSLVLLVAVYGCGGAGGGGTAEPDSTEDFTYENIDFVIIPSGSFSMGGSSIINDAPTVSVSMSSFKISVYEITNEQYVNFLNSAYADGWVEVEHRLFNDVCGSYYNYVAISAGNAPYPGYMMIQFAEDGGCTSLGEPEHEDNRSWIAFDSDSSEFILLDNSKADWPVNWVKWYGAFTFARYYEANLPTEAQWEYAARANRALEYATNDGTLNSENANYNGDIAGVYNPDGHVMEVGSFAANPFGLYDMSGNVWEWCLDYYDPYYYISGRMDPVNLDPGTNAKRVKRGGSWNYHSTALLNSSRSSDYENRGNNHFGFRIVIND